LFGEPSFSKQKHISKKLILTLNEYIIIAVKADSNIRYSKAILQIASKRPKLKIDSVLSRALYKTETVKRFCKSFFTVERTILQGRFTVKRPA